MKQATILTTISNFLTAWFILIVIIFSSLVINVFQVASLVFLAADQRASLDARQWLANLWWPWFPVVMEVWGKVRYRFTGDRIPDHESALLMCNHGPGFDFVTGVFVSARSLRIRCGKMMTFMKDSIKWIPTVGWVQYLQGALYLKRNWERDHGAIKARLDDMEQNRFPRPFWIGLYPEGTRITPAKKAESVAFAKSKGLPELQHVLLPRPKGFTFIMQSLPTAITAVYDATVAYSGSACYLSDALFRGGFKTDFVNLDFRRIAVSDIPKDEKGLQGWLMNTFKEKDNLLEIFERTDRFPGEEVVYPNLLIGYFYHFLAWSSLFTLTVYLCTGPSIWTLVCLLYIAFLSFTSLNYISTAERDRAEVTSSGVTKVQKKNS